MRRKIAFRRYRLAFRQPLRTAHGLWTEREGLILRSETESGAVGWGEAAPVPGFGMESVDALAGACGAWPSEFDGDRPPDVPASLPTLRNALQCLGRSAPCGLPGGAPAETGSERLSNAAAKAASGRAGKIQTEAPGEGLSNEAAFLRGNAAPLPVAALLPAGRAALAAARIKADAGFRVFKWKVGAGDLADELALLDDLCAVLPAGGKLRLDANGAWDRRGASRWLERCADRPVEHVEQPIARDARGADDLLRGLAGDYPTALALDESLVGEGDLDRWLGGGWPGVYVIKPALFADPGNALDRLARAKARVVFSSALETAVGARAALRLAFAWGAERRALGFGVWPLFVNPACDGPSAAPFIRCSDVERLDLEAAWNAAS